jgi:cytochrome c oxidase subunit II
MRAAVCRKSSGSAARRRARSFSRRGGIQLERILRVETHATLPLGASVRTYFAGHFIRRLGAVMQKLFRYLATPAIFWVTSGAIILAQTLENQSAPPQVIAVNAKKYEFSPGEIHVHKSVRVQLRIHSEDVVHGAKLNLYPEGSSDKGTPGLLFRDPAENGKVEKGVDQVLDFVAQQTGVYELKCAKVCGFGHSRMKGKLIVEP